MSEPKDKEQVEETAKEEVLMKLSSKLQTALLALMNKRPFKEVFQLVKIMEESTDNTYSDQFVNTVANYIAGFNYDEVKPYMDMLSTDIVIVDKDGNPVEEDVNVVEAPTKKNKSKKEKATA
jgi:Golgi nucleoside diphosphatase